MSMVVVPIDALSLPVANHPAKGRPSRPKDEAYASVQSSGKAHGLQRGTRLRGQASERGGGSETMWLITNWLRRSE